MYGRDLNCNTHILKKKHLILRFKKYLGKLVDTNQIKKIKKNIARKKSYKKTNSLCLKKF